MVTEYLPTIIFFFVAAIGLLAWGHSIKDYVVIFLGSILCFGIAIYTSTQGIQNMNNFLTTIFAVTNFALGAYFSVRGAYELYILNSL